MRPDPGYSYRPIYRLSYPAESIPTSCGMDAIARGFGPESSSDIHLLLSFIPREWCTYLCQLPRPLHILPIKPSTWQPGILTWSLLSPSTLRPLSWPTGWAIRMCAEHGPSGTLKTRADLPGISFLFTVVQDGMIQDDRLPFHRFSRQPLTRTQDVSGPKLASARQIQRGRLHFP